MIKLSQPHKEIFRKKEIDSLNCHRNHLGKKFTHFLTFWLERVTSCMVAAAGLFANLAGVFILCKEDMHNSFHSMLVALICMDQLHLLSFLLGQTGQLLDVVTDLHKPLIPYFVYPFSSIAMTASIFMTVGIALERFISVNNPINHRQAIDSPGACKRRLFKYVAGVAIFSVIINLPKFFEFEIQVQNGDAPSSSKENSTRSSDIVPTALRLDPDYIVYYISWTRLALTGLLPILLLIIFNYGVHKEVKNRNQRLTTMTAMNSSETASMAARQRREAHLAAVLMGIVLLFAVCHATRVAIQ